MQGEKWGHVAGRRSRIQPLLFLTTLILLGLAFACAGSGGGSSSMPAVVAGAGGDPAPSPGSTPGGSGGGTGGGTVSPATAPQTGTFLFAGSGSGIWAGQVDGATGQVTVLPATSTDGARVVFLTSDPQGRFLYAAQQAGASGTTGIGVFAIDTATGVLARGESVALPNVPNAILTDRAGKAVYAPDDGVIRVFSVAGNGLAAGPTFAAATVGRLWAITPDGRLLINVGGGQAAVFSVDPQTGRPAQIGGSPFSTGASAEQSVAVSPNGKLLFILSPGADSGNIAVMNITASGGLSLVPQCVRTSPQTVGCFPPPVLGAVSPRQGSSSVPSMVLDFLGHSLYLLAGDLNGSTRVVRLDAGIDGALGVISSLAQGIAANSLAVDSAGRFLFVGTGSPGPGTLLSVGTNRIPEPVLSTTPGFTGDTNLVAVP